MSSEEQPTNESGETDVITIGRSELFTKQVDRALARARATNGRPAEESVSWFRRVVFSSLFYLPLAGFLGALGSHALIERYITDQRHVAGQIALVNADPFDARDGTIALTIGRDVVYVSPRTYNEQGPGGERALLWEDLRVGAWVEVMTATELDTKADKRVALAIRPTNDSAATAVQAEAARASPWALAALFPATAIAIAIALLLAEALSRRNWGRVVQRALVGGALAALLSILALIPAGFVRNLLDSQGMGGQPDGGWVWMTWRACVWACVGAGLGFGMNVSRSTRGELRNSVVGGALGGAFGGLFFDPISTFRGSAFSDANVSRLVGTCVVGLSIGLFVALLERMTREAWIRVRTGPLAGKSFILYRSPTVLGSAPSDDIYLFKDAAIGPRHASIHRVGQTYELEDHGNDSGVEVGGRKVTRHRLSSGDTIVVGSTVLEFEERAKHPFRTNIPSNSPTGAT